MLRRASGPRWANRARFRLEQGYVCDQSEGHEIKEGRQLVGMLSSRASASL